MESKITPNRRAFENDVKDCDLETMETNLCRTARTVVCEVG
ncbi:MAG: hypothetical protein ACI4HZ_10775 [Ruminococcus sp.]